MSTWILIILLNCGDYICSSQYLRSSDLFDCLATKQAVAAVYEERDRMVRVACMERYDWNAKQLAFGHPVRRKP